MVVAGGIGGERGMLESAVFGFVEKRLLGALLKCPS